MDDDTKSERASDTERVEAAWNIVTRYINGFMTADQAMAAVAMSLAGARLDFERVKDWPPSYRMEVVQGGASVEAIAKKLMDAVG